MPVPTGPSDDRQPVDELDLEALVVAEVAQCRDAGDRARQLADSDVQPDRHDQVRNVPSSSPLAAASIRPGRNGLISVTAAPRLDALEAVLKELRVEPDLERLALVVDRQRSDASPTSGVWAETSRARPRSSSRSGALRWAIRLTRRTTARSSAADHELRARSSRAELPIVRELTIDQRDDSVTRSMPNTIWLSCA